MTEVVLAYDKSIVGQETGYWCGPASTQVVLSGNKIQVAESQLAKEIGTTTRGTDYVGLIERVLDRYCADVNYTSVYTERDPMSDDQKETLWRNLVQSISAGCGVVMNWVAPPSNKPRGVKGSVSPRYSGGTTFHYVSAMGFSDEGGRFVWIADSGFQPQGYWITFDQCATLIPPKGYCYANTGKVLPPTPIQTPPVALVSKAFGDVLTLDQYAKLLPFIQDCLRKSKCDTNNRIAMWFAQVGHESVGLKFMRELWGPTADQRNYDNMMGNGPGEGRKYLGRGPIQVTGKNNYRALSQWAKDNGFIDSPTLFVDKPELLEEYQYAFMGAIWYWLTGAGGQLNSFADQGNIEDASKAINAPAWIGNSQRRARGIDDRIARWNRCRAMDLTKILGTESEDGDVSPELEKMIRELHADRFGPRASTSKYRDGDEKRWTRTLLDENEDAMLYEAKVEKLAILGDSHHIGLVAREASKGDTESQSVFIRIDTKWLTAEQIELKSALIAKRGIGA